MRSNVNVSSVCRNVNCQYFILLTRLGTALKSTLCDCQNQQKKKVPCSCFYFTRDDWMFSFLQFSTLMLEHRCRK